MKTHRNIIEELTRIIYKNCKIILSYGINDNNKILLSQNTQLQAWIYDIIQTDNLPKACYSFLQEQEFFEIREQPVNVKQLSIFK